MKSFKRVASCAVLSISLFSVSLAAAQNGTSGPAQATGATTTDRNDHRRDGFDMGWLGLIGLAGLAGLRRKRDDNSRPIGDRR